MRLLKTGEESLFVTVATRMPTADAARISFCTSYTTIQLPAFLDSRLRGDSTGTRLTSTFPVTLNIMVILDFSHLLSVDIPVEIADELDKWLQAKWQRGNRQ